MLMKLYSIKDVVVGNFKNPAQFTNDAEAVRAVKYACNSINDISTNCDDLQLWCVGSFDTETGVIESNLSLVINVVDCVNPEVYQAIKKPNINQEVKDDGRKD